MQITIDTEELKQLLTEIVQECLDGDLPFGKHLTPPQIAKRFGVKPETVIAWIKSGHLHGMDMSRRPGVGRPRYRIRLSDVLEFEDRRAKTVATPLAPVCQKRKRSLDVIKFF